MGALTLTTQQFLTVDKLSGFIAEDLNDLERKSVLALACKLLEMEMTPGYMVFNSPEKIKDHLRMKYIYAEHEIFSVLFLDQRHRLIRHEELFIGTIDGCSVYPREVVKAALRLNSAAVVFAHNHPSGVAEPSMADKNITRRLQDALALIDVRVLDHIVVGREGVVSFAELGLM